MNRQQIINFFLLLTNFFIFFIILLKNYVPGQEMFENYSPQTLRDAIEYELQKTDDAKMASIIAMKRLEKDPTYYDDKYMCLNKAKYIKKIPDGKGGYKYIYKEGSKKEKKVDQTETPEFKKWFSNSKVVDKNGKPLVVYHGTHEQFNIFDKNKLGSKTAMPTNKLGFFFSGSKRKASNVYSKWYIDNQRVLSVYLKMENPYYTTSKEFYQYDTPEKVELLRIELLKKKHDGIIVKSKGLSGFSDEYMVFEPNQVKSATENKGTFDPNSSDMTKARPTKYLRKFKGKDGKLVYIYKEDKKEKNKDISILASNKDKNFETGKSVTFKYIRNPESSKKHVSGNKFQQNIEPKGKYMSESSGFIPQGWESGTMTFNNPLVIKFSTDGEDSYNENSWKVNLYRKYGNKNGKELSSAIKKDGYDGIVTIDRKGYASEIIKL